MNREANNAKEYLSNMGYRVGFGYFSRPKMSGPVQQTNSSGSGFSGSPGLPLQPWSNNEGNVVHAGACETCGQTTTYKCGRCGDFYCSQECQKQDWLKHRATCFKMPKLVQSKN